MFKFFVRLKKSRIFVKSLINKKYYGKKVY